VSPGSYYGLDAVSLRALRPWLCEEADGPTCAAEMFKFVEELIDNGIVHAAAA
jgi:hypothetical protein